MCVFGPISTTQGVNHPDDLRTFFETGSNHRFVNEVGNERIRGNKYVSAGYQDRHENSGKAFEEPPQGQPVLLGQNSKSRDGFALATVKCRRNAPDSASATLELFQFAIGVLEQAVRRIGNHSMDRIGRGPPEPVKRVGAENSMICRGRRGQRARICSTGASNNDRERYGGLERERVLFAASRHVARPDYIKKQEGTK